jgi:hypothetical protein
MYRFNKPFIVVDGIEVFLEDLTEYHKSKLDGYLDLDLIQETLVDKFFNLIGNDLLFDETRSEEILNNIEKVCKENNINVFYHNSNIEYAYIEKNNMHIYGHSQTPNKNIIYMILHEVSHFITNSASKNKLLKYITHPNNSNVDMRNLHQVKIELEYFLNPAEMSNWAFSFALSIFEDMNDSVDNIYRKMKIDNTNYHKLLPEQLQILNNLVNFCLHFKKSSNDKQSSKKFVDRLSRLINLINKYVKRLKKIFPNSAAQKSKNFK